MSDDTPWARRLVVCCDGTWQSSVTTKESMPSNITKICRLIARIGEDKNDPSKKFHQVVFYDAGVGTGAVSAYDATRQGGTGAGLAENVIQAYNFIVQNYVPGDEIFCFGFSRGAYTARAVAGLVSDIGVLRPIDMANFPELYRLYMTNDKGVPFRKSEEWSWFEKGKLSKQGEELKKKGVDVDSIGLGDLKELAEAWEIRPHGDLAHPNSQTVKVVGVFDTVGSLGIPDMAGINLARERTQYGFHNVKLTENIEHAYQALALEERREAFRPTLWYISQDLVDDPGRPTPELKQAWFPGVHINCGGGDDDCLSGKLGDSENLSIATLCWMLQCVSPHLTIDRQAFELYLAQYKRWLFKIRYACTYHHATLAENLLSYLPGLPSIPFLNSGQDELAAPRRDPPHTHPEFDFSWGTGPLTDSFGGIYYLNGTHERMPGHEYVQAYDEKTQDFQWKSLRELGQTNEYVHPIVYHRHLVHGWDTHSPLKDGWNREHWCGKDGKDRFWWYQNGEKETCALPEWAILPDVSQEEYNFERKWYGECEKTKKTLDALAKVKDFGPNDFLATLDKTVDFGFNNKPQNLWP